MKNIFAVVLFVPGIIFAQSVYDLNSGAVHHVNDDGIPIVNSVVDGVKKRSEMDTNKCIADQSALDNHINVLNGKLYRMETNNDLYYVRHQDRMAIIWLIQNNITPIKEQINHGIFHSLPGGSGAYCDRKLKDGINLADGIYNANLEYRKNGR